MSKKEKPKELLQRILEPNFKEPTVIECAGETEDGKYEDILAVYKRKMLSKEYSEYNNSEALRVVKEKMYKLFLLLDYHDIERNDEEKWFKLAWKLAEVYEPGFKTGKPAGRKNEWSNLLLAGLWAKVQLLVREKNISESNACGIIKNQYFKQKVITKKTLENKLAEAKKSETVKGLIEYAKSFGDDAVTDSGLVALVHYFWKPEEPPRYKYTFYEGLQELFKNELKN